jgi:hypothetical protein
VRFFFEMIKGDCLKFTDLLEGSTCVVCLQVADGGSVDNKNYCQQCLRNLIRERSGGRILMEGVLVIKPGAQIYGGNYIDYNTTKKEKIMKKLKRTDLSDKKRKKLEKKLKKLN